MAELTAVRRDAPGVEVEVTPGIVASDGADLYYEYSGQGPVLLLIPGGGGDAGIYTLARQHLASDDTVVSCDPRGRSRSSGGADSWIAIPEEFAAKVREAFAGYRDLALSTSAP